MIAAAFSRVPAETQSRPSLQSGLSLPRHELPAHGEAPERRPSPTLQLAIKLFPKDINSCSASSAVHAAPSRASTSRLEPICSKKVLQHPSQQRARPTAGLGRDRPLAGHSWTRSAEHYERVLETMPDQAPALARLPPRSCWPSATPRPRSWPYASAAPLSARTPIPTRAWIWASSSAPQGRLEPTPIAALDDALKADPARTDIALTRGLLAPGSRPLRRREFRRKRPGLRPTRPIPWRSGSPRASSLRDDHRNDALKDLRAAAAGIPPLPLRRGGGQALLAARLEGRSGSLEARFRQALRRGQRLRAR